MTDGIAAAQPVGTLRLRGEWGAIVADDGPLWLGEATIEDEVVLDRAVGPVLDVGCGPGRHLAALARRGVDGLGIDVTPAAVRLARARGVPVVEGSIFGPVPQARAWATALLLDGNIGIGGCPATLLSRVASLLQPRGRILVELDAPGTRAEVERARLEGDVDPGPWFAWTSVDAASIQPFAAQTALHVTASWSAGDRWFAHLTNSGQARRLEVGGE